MIVIGVDPHKQSHTAVAVDGDEQPLARVRVSADSRQAERLLDFAVPFDNRVWAIEAAGGLGLLLAQQLVAAGESVLDVPPALSARVRLLNRGRSAKSDPNDALSAAVVALRHADLRRVGAEDHTVVLRLLADAHHDLVAARTRSVCRLHALLAALSAGGHAGRLSAEAAGQRLKSIHPCSAADAERKRLALCHVADIARLDDELVDTKARIADAVDASGSSVTEVYGIGPIGAAIVLGHTGSVARFSSRDHYAAYNASAPIEASSGPKVRHRLNPRGNRQLNHALHVAAITQVAHKTPGRAYYLRKIEEGKSPKEAMRALKRRISDAVWRRLQADAQSLTAGPGGHSGTTRNQRGRTRTLKAGSSVKSLPDPAAHPTSTPLRAGPSGLQLGVLEAS